MWSYVVIAVAEELEVVVAEFEFLLHGEVVSLYFAIGGWFVYPASDVDNVLLATPVVELAVSAGTAKF